MLYCAHRAGEGSAGADAASREGNREGFAEKEGAASTLRGRNEGWGLAERRALALGWRMAGI
eukprot:gene16414-biopygen309